MGSVNAKTIKRQQVEKNECLKMENKYEWASKSQGWRDKPSDRENLNQTDKVEESDKDRKSV